MAADQSSVIARRLLASWRSLSGGSLTGSKKRPFNSHQMALVHGLCAHAHYIGEVALDLLDDGLTLAAFPLVRSCFEAAVRAQWVAQTQDGYLALQNEAIRQRTAFVRTLERAASDIFRNAAPNLAPTLASVGEADASARSFSDICDDLNPGGADAYTFYRRMSTMTHPSVEVALHYLRPVDAAPGVTLSMEPDEPEAGTWTYLVAASLVWAGRAVDFMDKHNKRRSELRSVAAELGIAPELQLSVKAVLREQGTRRPRPASTPASPTPSSNVMTGGGAP